MATVDEPRPRTPYVPRITPEELRRRNAEMIAVLDDWEQNGDEQEQRETMDVIRQALGPDRVMGYRNPLG